MKNYGNTTDGDSLQTLQSVERIIGENGLFFSINSTDTILEKEIPKGSLILISTTQQLFTSIEKLLPGQSIDEQAENVLVASGITWQTFN